MKLPFPINTNTVSLLLATLTVVCFLVGGIFGILDYPFFLILLIILILSISIGILVVLLKKSVKNNRLEEIPQDDTI